MNMSQADMTQVPELNYKFALHQIQNRSHGLLFADGSVLCYGQGRYDAYCLYLVRSVWDEQVQEFRSLCGVVPDRYYYHILLAMAKTYGYELVYEKLLVRLYNSVGQQFDQSVLVRLYDTIESLTEISDIDDKIHLYKALTMVYYGMIAEEQHGMTPTAVNPTPRPPVCGKVLKLYALYCLLNWQKTRDDDFTNYVCQMLQNRPAQELLQDAARVGVYRTIAVQTL